MPLLTSVNIEHAYGQRTVLDGVSLSLEAGERVGIVGRNGCGKSTLLKILAGRLTPESGRVHVAKGSKAGYLEQEHPFSAGETVFGVAAGGYAELHGLQRRLEGVFEEMAGAEGAALERLMREQERLEREVEAAGGYAIEHTIERVLHGLGFVDAQFELDVSVLSGGQKSRLALARLLLEQPDVLLLDEPTNHLDLDGRVWLERFLRDEYRGAVLMISHDRYLLDAVVKRIVEVEDGRLIDYPGSYKEFRVLRVERREAMQRAWEKQQTRFKREEAFIRKYKAGQRAKQARGRESRLDREKERALERPMELGTLSLELPKAERTGDQVIKARGLGQRYEAEEGGTKVLFEGFDVTIGRGERWGIIGPNGAGKSTLVRCMLGETTPQEGEVRLGTKLAIGYFTQTHEGLDPSKTVVRYLQDVIRKECEGQVLSEQAARDLAGAFLFSGGEQEKELGVMSGGERARAVIAGLLASAKNLLVLDEPTNHLDISSSERLETAMRSREQGGTFDGTLLLISHDRALIDACCDHLIVLDGAGGAEVVLGNYSEWHARQTDTGRVEEARAPAPAPPSVPEAPAKTVEAEGVKSKHSWMPVERLESEIERIEGAIARLDEKLNDPDVWKDALAAAELTAERDELKRELGEYEEVWLRKMG